MNVARQALIIPLIQLLLSMFLVSNVVGLIRHKNEEHISGIHIAELRKKAEQGNADGQYTLGLMYAVGKKFRGITRKQLSGSEKQLNKGMLMPSLTWGTCSINKCGEISI